MKRSFAGMAAVFLAAILLFPCKVHAVSAQSAIVMDAATGRILYEKNADERSLIASTTKIMTALIICEQCNVLDRVRIPKQAVGIEGSSMYLREGEVLTIQDLLYGLMLRSGNDAAVALAIYCSGTVEGFAQLMNDKAHRLEMKDSHFVNPNGLDAPGHYSTARDMAVLAAYAMENPIFAQTVSTKSVRVGERLLQNHNKLLWQLEGAEGVKTGYTKAAGRILVSSAKRQGRRLVAVTINDPSDWTDHAALLNDGFSRYQLREILSKGEYLRSIEVESGQADSVGIYAQESFSYPLSNAEEVKVILQEPGFTYAPVVAGESAGFAYILVDGNVIGRVPTYFGDTIEIRNEEKEPFWRKILGGDHA